MVKPEIKEVLNANLEVSNANLQATSKFSMGSTTKEPVGFNELHQIEPNQLNSHDCIMQSNSQEDAPIASNRIEGDKDYDDQFLPNIRGQTATRFFTAK